MYKSVSQGKSYRGYPWRFFYNNHQGRVQVFWKGVSILGLQAKKGDPGGGPTLGSMLKSLQRGQKRGGPDPLDTPRPRCAHYHARTSERPWQYLNIWPFMKYKDVSTKKGASETFGTDVMFCSAHCGVIIQRKSDMKIWSYSQENSLLGVSNVYTWPRYC